MIAEGEKTAAGVIELRGGSVRGAQRRRKLEFVGLLIFLFGNASSLTTHGLSFRHSLLNEVETSPEIVPR